MSKNVMEFNEQQQAAIHAAVEWYKGWQDRKHRKQVFFLAGYAGTGKTSIAQHIAEQCCGIQRTVFIAPTGKAASRLRAKGCYGARTLHNFVYRVAGEDEEKNPIFIGKGALDEMPKLVVMDESSMVGERDNKTLMDHGIPVLALGDIGQIPPVKAAAVYTEANVDFLLTDIMRQDAESNIVRASMFVRQGKRLPVREYEDVKVRDGEIPDDVFKEHISEEAQILCSYNSTRETMNKRARKALGFKGNLPEVGEKIVCTSNQHGYGIMNGEQGIVISYFENPKEYGDDEGTMMVTVRSLTDGKVRFVRFNPLSFDKDAEVRAESQKKEGGFDFGYALTVHKSQGSEWSKVLVVEEILRGVPYDKLMYTAITRAIDVLTIYRGN